MAANLFEEIQRQLTPKTVSQLGEKTGGNPSQMSQILSAALPLLLGALANNAARPGGAAALSQAIERDGHGKQDADQVLEQQLAAPSRESDKMVDHMLGSRRQPIEQALAAKTGMSPGTISQILQTLGPLVLSAVGKQKQEQKMDPGALAGYLNQQKQSAKNQSGDLGGFLFDMLDANDDGSVVDDVMRMAGQFFGNKPQRPS